MKRLGVITLVILVGATIQPSATTFDVRFPVITCLTDTAADEKVMRINCRKPTEVVDALQWQVDALSELRVGWDLEDRCGAQYRKAREWLENDRPSLLRNAQSLLAECNLAGSAARMKVSGARD